ncbi:RagB/SusD family nutrient uptake outer membrane protein [Chitinophaga sp. XS-30]|uniref:RagB/SusD family nutrient uptake outer membrane protein n=1 Tax=Chitinophaga sp. XS-30 TaxID=2604421 RepID=UPI0011DC9753|nr:RagB/SusD family nutrient uptake outer membrane protein [Chitinophaga sp. XS-30]QEH42146.1 RagB/SusD family nutrient uptake outer membrane protein [Chitinophaga sp. XS-30]
MKNGINISTIIIGIAAALTISACSKSWLNPAVPGEFTATDSTFIDPANAVKFVNACYTQLLTWDQSGFAWVGVTSITSDDADKGSAPGDLGTDKDQLDNLTYSSTTPSFRSLWRSNSQGISRCNQALANVPKFQITDALKSRLRGEALFLRAFYYFNMVRSFGDVPIVDTVVNAENPADLEKINSRRPVADVYAFIESDLNLALSLLPGKEAYDAADLGRATKGAAAALLAKVSMYQQKWDQVLLLTDDIIDGTYGAYALVPDYATIWREVGENNAESLFEIQSKGTAPFAAVQQYSQVQGIRGGTFNAGAQVFTGWGFNSVSEDLYNAYENGDVRRKATIMSIGDTLFDGVIIINAANPRYNYKAYVSRTQETYGNTTSTANKNVRILRMGEVYLMNAEAANELGQASKAQFSLNAVRNRAGLANTPAASQTDLRSAIWKERRVELAMEHDRFYDLVRQGRAGEVMRAHGKAFVDGKHEVFPVPQDEIYASDYKLMQNSGY